MLKSTSQGKPERLKGEITMGGVCGSLVLLASFGLSFWLGSLGSGFALFPAIIGLGKALELACDYR